MSWSSQQIREEEVNKAGEADTFKGMDALFYSCAIGIQVRGVVTSGVEEQTVDDASQRGAVKWTVGREPAAR